MVDYNVVTPKL